MKLRVCLLTCTSVWCRYARVCIYTNVRKKRLEGIGEESERMCVGAILLLKLVHLHLTDCVVIFKKS